MNTQYITPKVWDELQARWPGAARFLLRENLRGELASLETELKNPALDPRRRVWATARVEELRKLFTPDEDRPGIR